MADHSKGIRLPSSDSSESFCLPNLNNPTFLENNVWSVDSILSEEDMDEVDPTIMQSGANFEFSFHHTCKI